MAKQFLSRLHRDESGAVLIEFSLWTVLFFFAAMAGLDFGSYYLQRGAVDEAVSAAAVSAFANRETVNFDGLPDYVRSLSDDPALTVSTSCNGVAGSCVNLSRTCACLNGTGGYVPATACGDPCVGMTAGSTAGYYLTIRASKPYEPLMIPTNGITGKQISLVATVRLQ